MLASAAVILFITKGAPSYGLPTELLPPLH
jgi:hypothetical protein